MKSYEFTKSQRLWIAIALVAVVVVLAAGLRFRWAIFPSLTETPTQATVAPDSQRQVIRVGGDDSYPPFSYLENGEAKGFDNDLMRALAEVMGVDVEFHLSTWAEARQNLLDGKVDVIGGMAYSAERDALYDFTTPHAELYFDLFVRNNSSIKSINDISGKQIIVQAGGIMEDYLAKNGFTGEVIYADSPLAALQLLSIGKYDGALLNKMQGYYFISENYLVNLRSTGAFIDQRPYSIAVAEGNDALLRELNQALATIDATGVFNQLNQKWLFKYQRQSFLFEARYFIFVGTGLLIVTLFAFFWLWVVRRTVRQRTKELHRSEEKYRQLIQNATEGVVVVSEGDILYINPQGRKILGIPAEADNAQYRLGDFIDEVEITKIRHEYANAIQNEAVPLLTTIKVNNRKGETGRLMNASLVQMDWEEKPALLCFFADVTEERLAEEKIRASEERYRLLFTKSPVGLLYYDNDLKVTSSNEIMSRIMCARSSETLEHYDLNQIEDGRILPALRAVLDHEEGYYEGPFSPVGELAHCEIYISMHTTPFYNEKFEYKGGIALIEDISDKVKDERIIHDLETRYSTAFYTTPDAINVNRLADGVYLDCNRSFTEMTGYTREEIIGRSSLDIKIWAHTQDRERLVAGLTKDGFVKNLEAEFRMKNGKILTGLMSASMIEINGEACILSITRDITEIKRSQDIIQKNEERYRTIFESVPVSLWEQDFLTVYDMLEGLRDEGVTDLSGYMDLHPEFVEKAVKSVTVRDLNNESLVIFNAQSKTELAASIATMFTQESYTAFCKELLAIWEKQPIFNGETVNQTLDGKLITVNVIFRIPEKREDFSHIFVSIADISARKAAEEQVKLQVQHLAALRAVDMAISASMDLPIVLRVLLNQIQQQLKVHSASILLFNPSTQRLEFAAGAGFTSRAIEKTSLRIGQSYAGKAAAERRIVAADDLSSRFSKLVTEGMEKDGFTNYLGIPLISKGVVKGVLEIFHKGSLPSDPQWLSLLDSMASQAAIAIDNAALFEEAQRANADLRRAYDATIEGWARALEMRDGDTEGHSERVTEMAIQLARLVGIKESDLVDLRYGALLHDIGKMGIPDTILLKPARLTEEEWVIMRKHPTLSKEMLESIEFLKNSLDIPWCHHEKWDGTGYPRGLKGEEIPLMARVFSIIDAWDALRSDRPYRKAMADEEALKIIHDGVGKNYDPFVAEKFYQLIKKG
jgi:PAS domain S-box-containing protein/putative nucleotidyltransferase with HDIG domain